MANQYNRFFDQMVSVIDSINNDSDSSERLRNLQRLSKDIRPILIRSRDEAAYKLRTQYSGNDASVIAGVDRKYIDYWASRYREANKLPPLKRRKSIDLSNAIDLTHLAPSE